MTSLFRASSTSDVSTEEIVRSLATKSTGLPLAQTAVVTTSATRQRTASELLFVCGIEVMHMCTLSDLLALEPAICGEHIEGNFSLPACGFGDRSAIEIALSNLGTAAGKGIAPTGKLVESCQDWEIAACTSLAQTSDGGNVALTRSCGPTVPGHV